MFEILNNKFHLLEFCFKKNRKNMKSVKVTRDVAGTAKSFGEKLQHADSWTVVSTTLNR